MELESTDKYPAGISAFEPQIAQAGIVTNKNNTTESATKFFAIPLRFLILIDYHKKTQHLTFNG
jgi:hypothetical protein